MKTFRRIAAALCLNIGMAQAQQHPAPFADLHCHSLLKPYYSGWPDLWAFHEHECHSDAFDMVLEKSADVPKFTQGNLESLLLGNVRLVYLSLIPLEQEVRHPKVFRELAKLRNTMNCLAGIDPDWDFYLATKVDYFEELMGKCSMMERGERQPYVAGRDTLRYEIIRSGAQFDAVMADPKRMGIVVSIEGAHSLGVGPVTPEILASPEYREDLLAHLDVLKGIRPRPDNGQKIDYPVCVMTLNHFMWNGLSGHVKTFGQTMGYFIDQSEGMNTGVTPLGEEVVRRMLDRSQGRRILVDVKHMGIATRQWYYDHLEALRAHGDTVPVVATHVGVAGTSWAGLNVERNGNDRNKEAWLNQAPLSLFDEDIRQIHASRGVLGLMLDKYRCGGDLGNALVDATPVGSAQRRRAYIHILVANMLEVVDVLQCPEAWDIISIGSDYDGMISAMEPYDQAIKMPSLRDDLLAFFECPEDVLGLFPRRKVERYMYHLKPEQIVDKVMGGNLVRFTRRILDEQVGGPVAAAEAEGGR